MKRSEKVQKIVNEIFSYYGRKRISKEDSVNYLKNKGFSDEEISRIEFEAISTYIMIAGVIPVSREDNPLDVQPKIVFELLDETRYQILKEIEKQLERK